MNKIVVCHIPSDEYTLEEMCSFPARLTSKKVATLDEMLDLLNKPASTGIIKNVAEMNHGNALRFSGNPMFLIWGASRSFLSQITRHHVGIDFMSASQHYIDYSGNLDYEVPINIFEDCIKKNSTEDLREYRRSNLLATASYEGLIANGVKHEDARQVLPNAARNNLLVGANVNALLTLINQRCCALNCTEIMYVTDLIRDYLARIHPDIFKHAGPDCYNGKCRQKGRSCGKPWDKPGYFERWNLLRFVDNIPLFSGCPEVKGTVKIPVLIATKSGWRVAID